MIIERPELPRSRLVALGVFGRFLHSHLGGANEAILVPFLKIDVVSYNEFRVVVELLRYLLSCFSNSE
jgi:hypothetical protein